MKTENTKSTELTEALAKVAALEGELEKLSDSLDSAAERESDSEARVKELEAQASMFHDLFGKCCAAAGHTICGPPELAVTRIGDLRAKVTALEVALETVRDEREGYRQHLLAARERIRQLDTRVVALEALVAALEAAHGHGPMPEGQVKQEVAQGGEDGT